MTPEQWARQREKHKKVFPSGFGPAFCYLCGMSAPCLLDIYERRAVQAVKDKHEISALRADLEAAEERADAAEAHAARLAEALTFSAEEAGPIGHDAWMVIKRSHGFHGPGERCVQCAQLVMPETCLKIHEGLVAWDELSDYWREFDVAIFDRILAEIRQRATPDTAALLARYRAEQAVIAAIVAEQLADERLTELVHSGAEEEALNNQTRRLRGAARTARDAIANLRALTTPTPAPTPEEGASHAE